MRFKASVGVVAVAASLALWGTSVATAGTTLSTTLVGSEERPGPGDPDGSGFVTLTMNQGQGEICYELSYTGIEAPTAGHIHKAAAGQSGGVFVPLFGSEGAANKCVSATKAQIKEIRKNPEMFYVNIHNKTYLNGALRGQLGD